MKSSVRQKAIASAVNVSIVLAMSAPIGIYSGWEAMRTSFIVLLFLYNIIFRRRDIGMVVAKTYIERPSNLRYVSLYTLSCSTLFFWWLVPLDIALFNGICLQMPCLLFTGNTLHGLLARQWTVTRASRCPS